MELEDATPGDTVVKATKTPKSKRDLGVTSQLFLCTAAVCLGSSFQFGYNTGVINVPKDSITVWINETVEGTYSAPKIEFIFSICAGIWSVGGIIGALSAGYIADKFGRKWSLFLNSPLSITAAALFTISKVANNYYTVLFGRFISGINCGAHTTIAPLYLSEIAPVDLRGILGATNQLFITVGILISDILGLKAVLGSATLWPYCLGFTAVPTIIQTALLSFCVDSPKYLLIFKSDQNGAKNALQKLRGCADVEEDLNEIRQEYDHMKSLPKIQLLQFWKFRYLRWPLMISCVMMLSQQWCGFAVPVFYSKTVFQNTGMSESASEYSTIAMGFVFVVATAVSTAIMDKAGRRTLHLIGLSGMWFISILTCIFIVLSVIKRLSWASYPAAVCVILFVIAFAAGPGAVPWIIVSELFMQNARGIASSIAVGVNWTANLIVIVVLGNLLPMHDVGPYVLLIFTALLTVFIVFTYKFVPETKGRPVEEIVREFEPLAHEALD